MKISKKLWNFLKNFKIKYIHFQLRTGLEACSTLCTPICKFYRGCSLHWSITFPYWSPALNIRWISTTPASQPPNPAHKVYLYNLKSYYVPKQSYQIFSCLCNPTNAYPAYLQDNVRKLSSNSFLYSLSVIVLSDILCEYSNPYRYLLAETTNFAV